MFARLTRVALEGAPITKERIAGARGLMPVVSRMAGHKGAIWLMDRATGTGLAIDLYADAAALHNTSQGDIRDELIEMIEGRLLGVEEFEVVGIDRLLGEP